MRCEIPMPTDAYLDRIEKATRLLRKIKSKKFLLNRYALGTTLPLRMLLLIYYFHKVSSLLEVSNSLDHKLFFFLRRYDKRLGDYQSCCCCDIFLTFSFFKVNT